ncbi:GYD domain-containing protein [Pseudonocardia bannensis]|uniref:GYD domain-containing protein n=1 Tax=Pseudonocardia bannensis TaxID=630973 RepID=A0A848DSB8_9PSEU|nr:GYD domain-containing protein [Pseudonocardia bannensis]NMH95415.1 GYD domain-containing protein [Pseudonocardia bannensis]
MSKYVLFFSYTPETWERMMMKPADRTAAVRGLLESVGGELESLYYMFGDRDGLVIFDAPEAQDAAAVSLTVNTTGAFAHLETHALIAPTDLTRVLEKAGSARESYRRPGD